MADSEFGKCSVCGIVGNIARTYFHYEIKCECHSPNHFEIVYHCPTCTPIEPKETRLSIKTENLKSPTAPLSNEQEAIDNFAISFACWAMYDPQAKAYQEAGITAGGLLEKYKSRPYIDTNNPQKQ